jgi:hypothetical protein
MSHWKKFESNVLKKVKTDLLSVALHEMGLGIDTNIKSIRNSWGRDDVDAGLVDKNGNKLSLGFKLNSNGDDTSSLELTGDFYSTGLSETGFMDKLSQTYKKHEVMKQLEDSRWQFDEKDITTDADGNIVIDAYIFA